MPIADVTLSTEAIVMIGALLSALTVTVSVLFKMLIATKDAQLQDEKIQRRAYQDVAEEAVNILDERVTTHLRETGQPVVASIAPVIPEHSSPATIQQVKTAEFATLRARLVANKLALSDDKPNAKDIA